MTPIIEGFRQAFTGKGQLDFNLLIFSFTITLITVIIGLLIFNKVEKDFIDTV